jgi:hypothetical protein
MNGGSVLNNFVPEVRGTFQLPAKVSIHDATLRDGEQTPGVVFSVADKIAIAEKLDEVGVDRIEAGMPAVSEQDFQAIREPAQGHVSCSNMTRHANLPGCPGRGAGWPAPASVALVCHSMQIRTYRDYFPFAWRTRQAGFLFGGPPLAVVSIRQRSLARLRPSSRF